MFSRYLQNRGKEQSYMALQVSRKEHKAEQSKQALIKSKSSGGRVQKGEAMDIAGLMMTALREERKSSVLQQGWEDNLISLYTTS